MEPPRGVAAGVVDEASAFSVVVLRFDRGELLKNARNLLHTDDLVVGDPLRFHDALAADLQRLDGCTVVPAVPVLQGVLLLVAEFERDLHPLLGRDIVILVCHLRILVHHHDDLANATLALAHLVALGRILRKAVKLRPGQGTHIQARLLTIIEVLRVNLGNFDRFFAARRAFCDVKRLSAIRFSLEFAVVVGRTD